MSKPAIVDAYHADVFVVCRRWCRCLWQVPGRLRSSEDVVALSAKRVRHVVPVGVVHGAGGLDDEPGSRKDVVDDAGALGE